MHNEKVVRARFSSAEVWYDNGSTNYTSDNDTAATTTTTNNNNDNDDDNNDNC